jgi:hypothetical protein
MSIDRKINKEYVIHTSNGTSLSLKNGETLVTYRGHLLNEMSQMQRGKYCLILFVCVFCICSRCAKEPCIKRTIKKKLIAIESKMVVPTD